jgi:hypothetical protein
MIQQSENVFVLQEKVRDKDVWKHFKTYNFLPFLTSVEDWQDWVLFLLWKSHDPRSSQKNFNYEEKVSLPFELGGGRDEISVFDATFESIEESMIPEKKKLFEQAINNLVKSFWHEENFLDVLFDETRSCHGELFHFSSENLLFLLEKDISENSFSTVIVYLVSLEGSDALPRKKMVEILLNLQHKYRNDDEKLSDIAFAFIDMKAYLKALETMTCMHKVHEGFPSTLESHFTLGDGRYFLDWVKNPSIKEILQDKIYPRMQASIKDVFIEILDEAVANR